MYSIIASILMYYKYYPIIYVIVCTYHVYNYYEYAKVIAHYIKILSGKKEYINIPKEEDYEWIMIEDDLLKEIMNCYISIYFKIKNLSYIGIYYGAYF